MIIGMWLLKVAKNNNRYKNSWYFNQTIAIFSKSIVFILYHVMSAFVYVYFSWK